MIDTQKIQDRAAGAVVGALIGDALGLGPHWYYDLDQLRKHYGPWIDGYTEPLPGRYHEGLAAGSLSQTGLITLELLRSVVAAGGYDEVDFTRRLDTEFLQQMDGTPYAGPGGYTNQSIRELYQARIRDNKPWGQTGDYADTSEGAERAVVLAARYARFATEGAQQIAGNIRLTQIDPFVVALPGRASFSIAYLAGGNRPGGGNRAGLEGVAGLWHALFNPVHAAGGLLPGRSISRRLRTGRFACHQRRRTKHVAGDAHRRFGRGPGRSIRHPAEIHRRVGGGN